MPHTYKKSINNKINSNKGFTLTELIVVLAVLGILAALTVPAFSGYINKAKDRQIKDEARRCVMAAQTIVDEKYAADGVIPDDTYLKSQKFKQAVLSLAKLDGKAAGIAADADADTDGLTKITLQDKSTEIKTLTYKHKGSSDTPTGDDKKCVYSEGTYKAYYYDATNGS